jgi:diacylglycerol kinase (ATP)
MNKLDESPQLFDSMQKPVGLTRIYLAAKNSLRALKWLFKNESAFRQECLLFAIALPISFLFDITATEQAVLICSVLFVMLIEIVNTAIEVIVDRISLELHSLSGLAKDLGSAAVSISLIIMTLTWAIILLS